MGAVQLIQIRMGAVQLILSGWGLYSLFCQDGGCAAYSVRMGAVQLILSEYIGLIESYTLALVAIVPVSLASLVQHLEIHFHPFI